MADYTMDNTDKEKYRLQYSDLAPSLQDLINSKVDRPDLTNLNIDITNYSRRTEGIVVTEDSTFPENPTAYKNMHLSTTNRVVYVYVYGNDYENLGWYPVAMIPK